jgi:CheY-like chemotaxis protein
MASEEILIADDEPAVRTYIRNILKMEGYQLLEAADGLDAIEQIRQHIAPIDLLVTDIRMPRMDGVALARSVSEVYPGTPVVYISGYPFDLEEERSRHSGRPCAFLSKPFTPKTLLETVEKCLRAPENTLGAGN